MERVYTDVERVSCTFMEDQWNCQFRAIPGENVDEEPSVGEKVVVDLPDVHPILMGQSNLQVGGEDEPEEYAHTSTYFHDEIGEFTDEGVCLHEPQRDRLRCGMPEDFDPSLRNYIEAYRA